MQLRSIKCRQWLLAPLAAFALLAAACGDDGGGATATDAGGGEASGEAPIGDPELIAAAQEEGEVVLYGGGHTREGAELVAQMFEEEYGITVTFARQASGDVIQQVEAELAAGALNVDVVSSADASPFLRWAEEGIIMDSEVSNLDAMIEGFGDAGTPHVPYSVTPLGIMYNSAALEEDQVPQQWAELTDPSLGLVTVHADPAASGTALSFAHLMLNEIMGEDFYAGLAQNEVLVVDSSLALAQLVLTGEADLGVPAIESVVVNAQQEGEPLEIVYPEEGVPVFNAYLASMTDAPHPNAAKLLVQYHLSEEFQTALATQLSARSILADVPAPEAVPDLSDANLVQIDVLELQAARDEVLATFDQTIG